MLYYTITHLIGFVGTILAALGYQCKKPSQLFAVQALASVAYAVHFLMLGWYGSCFAQILVIFNSTLLCLAGRKWADWRGWKWLICGAITVFTAFNWQGIPSLISCLASISNTLSNWSKNGRIIRLARLFCVSPLWLVHDVMVGSFSGIICETLSISSILISIKRYGMKGLDEA